MIEWTKFEDELPPEDDMESGEFKTFMLFVTSTGHYTPITFLIS